MSRKFLLNCAAKAKKSFFSLSCNFKMFFSRIYERLSGVHEEQEEKNPNLLLFVFIFIISRGEWLERPRNQYEKILRSLLRVNILAICINSCLLRAEREKGAESCVAESLLVKFIPPKLEIIWVEMYFDWFMLARADVERNG